MTTIEQALKEFEGLSATLGESFDGLEMYLTFWEKFVKIQRKFASEVDDLVKSRHGKLTKLFSSHPVEHNEELLKCWQMLLTALGGVAGSMQTCSDTIHQSVCKPIYVLHGQKLSIQKANFQLGTKVLNDCQRDEQRLSQAKRQYQRISAAHQKADHEAQKAASEQKYRDAVDRNAQGHRQTFTVALPGLMREVEALEWERITAIRDTTVSALSAIQICGSNIATDQDQAPIVKAKQVYEALSRDGLDLRLKTQMSESLPVFEAIEPQGSVVDTSQPQENTSSSQPEPTKKKKKASTSLFQGLFDRLGGTDTTANTITTPASSSSKEKQGQVEEGQEQEQAQDGNQLHQQEEEKEGGEKEEEEGGDDGVVSASESVEQKMKDKRDNGGVEPGNDILSAHNKPKSGGKPQAKGRDADSGDKHEVLAEEKSVDGNTARDDTGEETKQAGTLDTGEKAESAPITGDGQKDAGNHGKNPDAAVKELIMTKKNKKKGKKKKKDRDEKNEESTSKDTTGQGNVQETTSKETTAAQGDKENGESDQKETEASPAHNADDSDDETF